MEHRLPVCTIEDPLPGLIDAGCAPPDWASVPFHAAWQACAEFQRSGKNLPAISTSAIPPNDCMYYRARLEVPQSWTDVEGAPVARILLEPAIERRAGTRAARAFGADRFLTLLVQESTARLQAPRRFQALGRTYEFVMVRDSRRGKNGLLAQVVYFATHVPPAHGSAVPLLALLHWHIPFNADNLEMPLHKVNKRLQLMFSRTQVGALLERYMLINTDDVYAEAAGGQRVLMTDGCAPVSFGLMRRVAKALELPRVPAAVQGRVGCAKGMWFLDPETVPNEPHLFYTRAFVPQGHHYSHAPWIHLAASQRKWSLPDPDKRSQCVLEVKGVSGPANVEAELNPQLLRVLEHNGVHVDTFVGLQDLYLDLVEGALRAGAVQICSPLTPPNAGVQRRLLCDLRATLDNLVGPHLSAVALASKSSRETFRRILRRTATQGRFPVPGTQYLYAIVDPTGTLAPGEVHVHLSNFGVLDGDILVGRSPCVLPWHVQCARAVARPELELFHDVIVFSSRLDPNGGAPRTLADTLSGGDYDGDRMWVCWNSTLVSQFRRPPPAADDEAERRMAAAQKFLSNALVAAQGAAQRLRDIEPSAVPQALYEAAVTNRPDSMLGVATVLHSHVNDERGLGDPYAVDLGLLCSELVDAPAAGKAVAPAVRHQLLREFDELRQPHWSKPDWLFDQLDDGHGISGGSRPSDDLIYSLIHSLGSSRYRRSRRARGVLLDRVLLRYASSL